MLPREKNGVVNPQLIVYGTKNLRVADLSIIPVHFASHTQCKSPAINGSGTVLLIDTHKKLPPMSLARKARFTMVCILRAAY